MPTGRSQLQPRDLAPPEQLRSELDRLKTKGVGFDLAWRQALRRIAWPHDKTSRDEWKRVFNEMRGVWSDCYHDVGSPLNVDHLAAALLHETDYEEDPL